MIRPSQRPLPDYTTFDEWSGRRRDLYLTTQHLQETNFHVSDRIRTLCPSKRAAVDPCLRPRGHWDRPKCGSYRAECRPTWATCCCLLARSCFTQFITAVKTFSSDEMFSWLFEISSCTCNRPWSPSADQQITRMYFTVFTRARHYTITCSYADASVRCLDIRRRDERFRRNGRRHSPNWIRSLFQRDCRSWFDSTYVSLPNSRFLPNFFSWKNSCTGIIFYRPKKLQSWQHCCIRSLHPSGILSLFFPP